MTTPLSAHFTLEEALLSPTASRLGIDNDPTLDIVLNMKQAALGMELVRMELNSNPIHINSWYRCPHLNRAVGSKPTSDHVLGFAIDFTCPAYGDPRSIVKAIMASGLKFKQVIYEFGDSNGGGWVHIAFNGDQRQSLIIDKDGARQFS